MLKAAASFMIVRLHLNLCFICHKQNYSICSPFYRGLKILLLVIAVLRETLLNLGDSRISGYKPRKRPAIRIFARANTTWNKRHPWEIKEDTAGALKWLKPPAGGSRIHCMSKWFPFTKTIIFAILLILCLKFQVFFFQSNIITILFLYLHSRKLKFIGWWVLGRCIFLLKIGCISNKLFSHLITRQ